MRSVVKIIAASIGFTTLFGSVMAQELRPIPGETTAEFELRKMSPIVGETKLEFERRMEFERQKIVRRLNERFGPLPQIVRDIITRDGALLCVNPFRLQEASKAIEHPEWLKEINCILAKGGLPIVRINDDYQSSRREVWQVRVMLPDGDGITLWGNYWNFAPADNPRDKIDSYGYRRSYGSQ